MANISKVYLLNTPLEDDMKNTLYFANASAQQSYMQNNILKTYTNVSYQRDTSVFRCPAHIDTIRNCNYMMYQNTAYSNKWFYGFIKKMTYIDDGRTDVEFEIDPIQTFMFDITVKPSFVEREHTNDDSFGKNTIPENVELGDYVTGNLGIQNAFEINPAHSMYALGITKISDELIKDHSDLSLLYIGSIPDGLMYMGFDSISDLKTAINVFNWDGHSDYINTVFVVPEGVFQNKQFLDGHVGTHYYGFNVYTTYTTNFDNSVSITTDHKLADNYSPRNAKLLTFPYRYLQMSNMAGSVANYHYEYFKDPLDGSIGDYVHFTLRGVAGQGCDIKVFPNQYKGINNNYDEGLSYAKLPIGSWNSDVFINWLTQNGVNIATGFASDLVSVGVGIATAPEGGGTAIASGVTGIANKIGTIYEHSMQPPQLEGATNVGNAGYAWSINRMCFKHMSIRPEMAKIIDDYFDMFGYATHRVKTPNSAHRQNWWYTKTIDCNITGNVPNDYMNQIKGAYNNGITFWRNPSNFLNYSVSNGIV